jgi:hypothetical protein
MLPFRKYDFTENHNLPALSTRPTTSDPSRANTLLLSHRTSGMFRISLEVFMINAGLLGRSAPLARLSFVHAGEHGSGA